MVKIEVKGARELVQKLGAIKALDTLEPSMQRSVVRVQSGMAKYPPARPRSKYVRTGTLGRRWTHKVDREGSGRLVGSVGNNTVYAPFVQSSQFQRRFFKGQWQTDREVLEQEKNAIVLDFGDAVRAALRK